MTKRKQPAKDPMPYMIQATYYDHGSYDQFYQNPCVDLEGALERVAEMRRKPEFSDIRLFQEIKID